MPSKNDRSSSTSNAAKTGKAGTADGTQVPGRDHATKDRAPDETLNESKAPEIGRRHDGQGQQDGPPHHDEPGRGSSLQGKHQDARGGPMGANQGGAPRGGSRVEPSHVHEQNKKERGDSRKPGK